MQTKVFELHAVAFPVFFLLFNPKLVVRSLSGILSQVHIQGATSFADFHFHFQVLPLPLLFWMYLPYPTLPYTIPPLER